MEFDIKRVYTAVNADELKVGSKVIVGDTVEAIRNRVNNGTAQLTLSEIRKDIYERRFRVKEYAETESAFSLVYLVSEPEEKKLKWTDLKIGDIIRSKEEACTVTRMVTGIDTAENHEHIEIGGYWLRDNDLKYWEKVE